MKLLICELLLLTLATTRVNGSAVADRVETRPKLVVLISLDQFRSDYFDRFMPFFGDEGFRRFVDEGSVLTNVRYRHAATMTCPGHSTLSTGTNANVNGVVANDWYDIASHRQVYCAEDTTVVLLGHPGAGRSPVLLRAKAIGDVLKGEVSAAKVFTVAGKDRSAIMLGGHAANAAYWLQDSVVVTSTYYMDRLPDWVDRFNARRLPQHLHGAVWTRVLPVEDYESTQGPDDVWNEEDRQALGKAFPHVITGGSDALDFNFYEALRKSPFDDEIVLAFAEDLILNEQLGSDDATDLLGIGFSSVDRIGHPYGPDSQEIMDDVVRTDRILADLFGFLDEHIGMKNVLVVLSADHGIQRFPEFVSDPEHGVWAARVSTSSMREDISAILDSAFGEPGGGLTWIESLIYPHVYLRREALLDRGVSLGQATQLIEAELTAKPQYDAAIPGEGDASAGTPERFSIYPGRSGDVLIRLSDHHINRNNEFGTTHGTPWEGDRHVPMLWLGVGVRHGVFDDPVNVVDLAPTLAAILNLDIPETMSGRVLRTIIARQAE